MSTVRPARAVIDLTSLRDRNACRRGMRKRLILIATGHGSGQRCTGLQAPWARGASGGVVAVDVAGEMNLNRQLIDARHVWLRTVDRGGNMAAGTSVTLRFRVQIE